MDVLGFFRVLLPVLCFLADSSCGEPRTITAESGRDITLSFRVPNDNILIVQWNRTDLGEDEYVFASRGGTVLEDKQHRLFKGRVGLQDRQMKDGDVSLTLKKVTTADSGTYEVRVFMEDTHSWISSTIYLSVAPPPDLTEVLAEVGGKEDGGKEDGGKEDGSVGLIVGLSFAAAVVVLAAAAAAAVGRVIYKKM